MFMKKFMYYCDPGIKWIDVTELTNTVGLCEFETDDVEKAIDFAKAYNYRFVGYSDAEKSQANLLNQQLESK